MIIKAIIDKRKPNKQNLYPIKIRFANNGKTVYHFLNMYADPVYFDDENGLLFLSNKVAKITKEQKEQFRHYNSIIVRETSKADNLLMELEKKGKDDISPARFKELYLNDRSYTAETFNQYFKDFISNKTGRTAEIYQTTINKIEKFFGKNIYFDDITLSWLESFDKKMQNENIKNKKGDIIKTGLEINARAIHFRNIRAVFNNAIDNEVINLDIYPFRKFKIKKEKTRKRALTLDHIQLLFDYEGKEHLNWARDVSKLIFFLIGINVKDLYYLNDIDNGYIYYNRAKTSRLYGIKIEPETMVLLEQFKGQENLFSFSDFELYQSLGKKINKHLKTISEELKIPKITTYTLRHTWATIAASLNIPKETIAAALGHGGNTVTDIYINFDQKKIDDANRLVMDLVLGIERNNNSNMIYEIKFLCNNDIYTVTMTFPLSILKKLDQQEIDSMLTTCIENEKKVHDVSDHEHIITQMRKSENGIDWIEMI
ncbi:site-specific integrase [Dysgonomonas capnocytophagoides]|uniref:site-specific integrase n=1 Tax=Dysgonomonas capnocytophagoides TaxID=45254 RepID=UPI0033409F3A